MKGKQYFSNFPGNRYQIQEQKRMVQSKLKCRMNFERREWISQSEVSTSISQSSLRDQSYVEARDNSIHNDRVEEERQIVSTLPQRREQWYLEQIKVMKIENQNVKFIFSTMIETKQLELQESEEKIKNLSKDLSQANRTLIQMRIKHQEENSNNQEIIKKLKQEVDYIMSSRRQLLLERKRSQNNCRQNQQQRKSLIKAQRMKYMKKQELMKSWGYESQKQNKNKLMDYLKELKEKRYCLKVEKEKTERVIQETYSIECYLQSKRKLEQMEGEYQKVKIFIEALEVKIKVTSKIGPERPIV